MRIKLATASLIAAGLAGALPASASTITVLNLPFAGSITDTAGHGFTAFGSPTISTATVAPGSTGSLQINGGSPNYLAFAPSADFNLGANNFKLSMDVYFTGPVSQYAGGLSAWGNTPSYQLDFAANDASSVLPRFNIVDQSGQHEILGSALGLNAWHDVSVQRVGATVSMTIDGNLVSSMTAFGALTVPVNPLWIGEPECGGDAQCWTHGSTFFIDAVNLTETVAEVPEPGVAALFGAAALWALTRRRSRSGPPAPQPA
jgi:hypothetical protein